MRFLKTTLKVILGLLILLTTIYFLGPKPARPPFALPTFQAAASLIDLEKNVNESEQNTKYIRPQNEARIAWADSTKKAKTKVALLYLHGFGASNKEGYPVDENLGKKFGCNVYLARLAEHGLEKGEENFLDFTAEAFYQSGEKALAIAQQLGDSVVIVGTSAGGALSLFLASRHPEIKAVLTYSPAIRLFRKDAALMGGPWGLQLAHFVTGKNHNDWVFKNEQHKKFWTNHQRFEGIVQFATFQRYTMIPETFAKVKCPVFVGFYYENEEKQDKVVSVAAMHEMFDQLGTPQYLKRKIAFPRANSHVIASQFLSEDWQGVERESIHFLQDMVGMKPLN